MWIPVLIQSGNMRPVIFGGGHVALRKAETLCQYGVQSLMVCPHSPKGVGRLSPHPKWINDTYQGVYLEGATLVIAATDDRELNHQICQDAQTLGILALNASDGNAGSLCFPNVGRTDNITIAVSTGGASPTAGAQILSELLEKVEANHWPERIRLLGELRQLLRETEPDCLVRHDRMREFGLMNLEELQKRRLEYEN